MLYGLTSRRIIWVAMIAIVFMMIPMVTVSALADEEVACTTDVLPGHGDVQEPRELASERLSGAMLTDIDGGDSVPRCSKFGFRTFYTFDASGYVYMNMYDANGKLLTKWDYYRSAGSKGWITFTTQTSKYPAGEYKLVLWTTYTDDIPFGYNIYLKDSVSIDGESITADSATYTGDPIEPSLTVTYKGWKLSNGADYAVTCTDNVDVGTANVKVTGKGAYTGAMSTTFTINAADIKSDKVAVECSDCLYTGDYVEPEVKVTYNGRALTKDVDYTLSFSSNKKIGTGKVTVYGDGNFKGYRYANFRIYEYEIARSDIAGIDGEYTYTGEAIAPVPKVTYDGRALVKDADYTIEYIDNVNAGTASVVVKGKGDFGGKKTCKFSIKPASLDGASVAAISKQVYTGKEIKPEVNVTLNGKKVPAQGLSVAYSNNINVGTAQVGITGKGNYSGKLGTTFEIVVCDVSKADVAAIPSQAYTGKALTPKPAYVKVNGRALSEGIDYTIAYENNVEPGTGKVIISGKGNYAGMRTATFSIDVLVEEIKLSCDKLVLKKGKKGTITAEVLPANAANKTLTWKSSNAKVATVDENGVVKAVKVGTATITAVANDGSEVKAAATVVVMKMPPKSVSLNKKKVTLEVGDNVKLKATVKPAKADDRSVTWISSDPSVATVNKKGKVTAVSVGTAKITATAANGKTAVCKITVKPTKVSKITVKGKKTMKVGDTQTLAVKIMPKDATDKTLTWKSSNTAVATVDGNGLVTAVSKGTVKITVRASDGGKVKAVFKIKVKK